ncbi:putative nuclease HARBI1 [Sparus aurata]|uniref:putative nuclease HARBI1 n=1 Tax=Sparus aurata TaxID=8175 RepID=UPI0011C1929A|nr:putative nuclease HARBI1 [Sparus aurata]
MRRRQRVWAHPRSQEWWDGVVPGFNNDMFMRNFRVSRESFSYICRRLSPVLQRKTTNYRLPMPDFCYAVIKVLLPDHIKTPDARKLMEMATFFDNRKGWHSIILQDVVDGKGLFWNVCVGFPGSVHDARVLRQSHFWEIVNDGQFFKQHTVNIAGRDLGHYIIGDPAYPLQPWLMKPFSDTGRLTQEQHNYNARLSSARAIVETTFGKLKGRWRCLLKRNDSQVDLTKKMVLACCVLLNICEEHGDRYLEGPTVMENVQPPVRMLQEHHQEGADVRAALLEYFNS